MGARRSFVFCRCANGMSQGVIRVSRYNYIYWIIIDKESSQLLLSKKKYFLENIFSQKYSRLGRVAKLRTRIKDSVCLTLQWIRALNFKPEIYTWSFYIGELQLEFNIVLLISRRQQGTADFRDRRRQTTLLVKCLLLLRL